jgi:hypothetical protein
MKEWVAVLRAADAAAAVINGASEAMLELFGYLCLRGFCWRNWFSAVDLPIGTGRGARESWNI